MLVDVRQRFAQHAVQGDALRIRLGLDRLVHVEHDLGLVEMREAGDLVVDQLGERRLARVVGLLGGEPAEHDLDLAS